MFTCSRSISSPSWLFIKKGKVVTSDWRKPADTAWPSSGVEVGSTCDGWPAPPPRTQGHRPSIVAGSRRQALWGNQRALRSGASRVALRWFPSLGLVQRVHKMWTLAAGLSTPLGTPAPRPQLRRISCPLCLREVGERYRPAFSLAIPATRSPGAPVWSPGRASRDAPPTGAGAPAECLLPVGGGAATPRWRLSEAQAGPLTISQGNLQRFPRSPLVLWFYCCFPKEKFLNFVYSHVSGVLLRLLGLASHLRPSSYGRAPSLIPSSSFMLFSSCSPFIYLGSVLYGVRSGLGVVSSWPIASITAWLPSAPRWEMPLGSYTEFLLAKVSRPLACHCRRGGGWGEAVEFCTRVASPAPLCLWFSRERTKRQQRLSSACTPSLLTPPPQCPPHSGPPRPRTSSLLMGRPGHQAEGLGWMAGASLAPASTWTPLVLPRR